MEKLISYLKHDLRQILSSKRIKIYYFIILFILLLDLTVTYFSNKSLGLLTSDHYLLLESSYSFMNRIYFFILPLLATFPFAMQYYIEKKNSFHISLITRGDKFNYLLSKFILNFVMGFLIIFFLLLSNYIISLIIFPFSKNIIADTMILPDNGAAFKNIFYSNVYIYQFIYILINSIIGGLFSLFAFVLSLTIKYKNEFLVIAVPFIIYIVQSIFLTFINPRYDLFHIAQPKTRGALKVPIDISSITLSIFIWFLIISILFYLETKREIEAL